VRQYSDLEGDFTAWTAVPEPCPKIVVVSGLPCGHPVELREWDSHDGAYTDYQFRCVGGGHRWWVEGSDS
jgi:hypothetical protein